MNTKVKNKSKSKEPVKEVQVEQVDMQPEETPIVEEIVEEVSKEVEQVTEIIEPEPISPKPTEVPKVNKKFDLAGLLSSLEGKLEKKALEEWPIKSLILFGETGERVSLTKRGNYEQSRKRSLKPSEWSVDELMDWMEGKLVGHRNTRPVDIWDEIYLRWGIPSNYTEEAAKEYAISGKVPESTDKGILVDDRRRVVADIMDLTYTELCSMYVGDVETDVEQSKLKRRIMTIARIVTDDHFNELINKFKQGEPNMSVLTSQILGVFEARKELYRKYGKRVTDEQLAVNTKAIYNNLRRVMKADYADFAETWRSILKFVDSNYATLFSPSQVRRGWAQLDLTGGNLYVLDRMLTLAVGTRNPATRRDDIRFYKLDYILEYVTNSKERENIIAFYTEH